MISPVVIKTAVGIAARAASDEKARNRMIVLIVTRWLSCFSLFHSLFYLITNPLSVLKSVSGCRGAGAGGRVSN